MTVFMGILIGFLIGVLFTIIFYLPDKITNFIEKINNLNEELYHWIWLWDKEFKNNKEMVKLLEGYGADVSKYKHKVLGEDNEKLAS